VRYGKGRADWLALFYFGYSALWASNRLAKELKRGNLGLVYNPAGENLWPQ
jgi:hypothetical protein